MSIDTKQRRACLRYGWSALVIFVSLGLALEALHLFKSPLYLEVHIRRELWTLGHAHGTLLALLNLLFAATMAYCFPQPESAKWAARCLRWGAALVPAGFFLGGWQTYESDPGLWVLLVPIGAVLVLIAVTLAAYGAWQKGEQ